MARAASSGVEMRRLVASRVLLREARIDIIWRLVLAVGEPGDFAPKNALGAKSPISLETTPRAAWRSCWQLACVAAGALIPQHHNMGRSLRAERRYRAFEPVLIDQAALWAPIGGSAPGSCDGGG